MTVIVNGHGRIDDEETTFVPVGQELKFYAAPGTDLSTAVNLIALAEGQFDDAVQTITGTGGDDDVPNYVYNSEDPVFLQRLQAMGGAAEGLDIRYVGYQIDDGTKLCSTPDTCLAGGEHSCSGILGTIKDPVIVILACRGGGGESTTMTTSYGSDPDNPLYTLADDTFAHAKQFVDLAATDPDLAEMQIASYPDGSIALMSTNKEFFGWYLASTIKNHAVHEDFVGLFNSLQMYAQQLPEASLWLVSVPSYGDALDTCAEAYPDAFMSWVEYTNDNAIRQLLAARPRIAAIMDEHASKPPPEDLIVDPCATCAHSLADHDPVTGCRASGCLCMGPDASFDDDDSDAAFAASLRGATCPDCGHDAFSHVVGVTCVVGCECTGANLPPT